MARVWLGVLAACGTSAAPGTTDPRSGARLELQVLLYEDGSRQLTDELFDAERDEPCRITPWSDGLRYCTPEAHRAVYVDPTCRRELGRVDPARATPVRYVLHEFFVAGRFLPSRLYHAGPPAEPPATVFQLRDGTCSQAPFGPGGEWVELGDEVPRGELVNVAARDHDVTGRIALRVETSHDGLVLPVGLHDRELEVDCRLDGPNQDHVECAPAVATEAVYFHDAACTEPELAAPEPPAIAAVTREGCTSYHAIGTQVGATPLFRLAPSCTPAVAPPGERLFLVGERHPLVALARERTGRLRVQPIAVAGLPDGWAFDTELGSDCRPVSLGDATRCLPHHVPAHAVFTDDACTQPAIVALVPTRACEPPVRFARLDQGEAITVFPIEDRAATVYEVTTGDRCDIYTPPDDIAIHAVGEPMPVDAFPAATKTREPAR
jgi:hypothetical protein